MKLWNSKVTIYNDTPADSVNPRRFDRFVVDDCIIQGGFVQTTQGTIQNIVNAVTVISKDVKHYKSPMEYAALPSDMKDGFYTAKIGDFVVFDAVDDVVTTAREFIDLQAKFKDNGMVITTVTANIFGLDVDNVTMTNA